MPLQLESHADALIAADAFSFRGVELLDEANGDLGWTIEYRQLERGCCSASFLMSEHHGMIFSGESFGARVHIVAEVPRGAFNFVVPVTGGAECRAQGQTVGDEDLLLFPPESEVNIVTRGAAGDLMLTVADADLQYVTASLFPGSQLFAKPDSQVHPGRAGRLDAVGAGITEAVSGRRTDLESLSELLACCIALVADSAGKATHEKLVGNDAKGKVVARALEFVEGGFAQAVRLEDLCRHAGVGVRVLQRVFREHLGVSPKQYIKVRRLNAARRLLASGYPSETTVSEIARQCGYAHLGRFSVDYRSHFGETPRQTLRR